MNKVLNFGSLNIDYVYKLDHFVRKGETISSEALNVYSGGKGLNQSVALAKAGAQVWHAGQIGEDGRFLLDVLRDAGADVTYVKISDKVRTGNAIIQNDHEGDNCIILYGGTNQAISEEQIDEVLTHFSKGDYLVLQNEINNLPYLVDCAYARGMKIALNPSPMDSKLHEVDLTKISIFLLNEVEAADLTGADPENPDALLAALQGHFPKAEIVLTLGSQGSVYTNGEVTVHQGIYKVKAVDTTAAGDTFSGFFLSGIIHGLEPADALDLAARASAIAVSRPGAAPSIPTLEEVKAATF